MGKVSLLIKTRIVTWVMIIISVYVIIIGLLLSYGFMEKSRIFRFSAILNGLLFLVLSFLLSNKKKFSWWPSIIMLSIIIISTILHGPLIPLNDYELTMLGIICVPFFAPLSLPLGLGGEFIGWLMAIILLIILLLFLIFDRKNFWKVAT